MSLSSLFNLAFQQQVTTVLLVGPHHEALCHKILGIHSPLSNKYFKAAPQVKPVPISLKVIKETECLDSASPRPQGWKLAGKGQTCRHKGKEGIPQVLLGGGGGMVSAQRHACNFHATHTRQPCLGHACQGPRGMHTCGMSEAEGAPPGQGTAPGSAPVPQQLQCSKPVTVTKEARKQSLPTHAHQLGGHIRARWATDKLTYAYIYTPSSPSALVKYEKKTKNKKDSQEPLPTWSPSAPLLGAKEFDPGKDV